MHKQIRLLHHLFGGDAGQSQIHSSDIALAHNSLRTIFLSAQFFEQLQTFVKVAGPHPLDLRRLSPVYIWLVCLISFFMLIASNGIVGIYEDVLGFHAGDVIYNEEKVANGLGGVGILIIVLRCMDKMYYREKLLPTSWFVWIEQQFYVDQATPQQRQRIQSVDSTSSFTEVLYILLILPSWLHCFSTF
jgi:hypothetical protein